MRTLHFNPRRRSHRAPQSRGIALAVVLVVMTILTLLGVVLMLQTDSTMLGARNEREVAVCRQAAEAATRHGMALASGFYDTTSRTFNSTILACTSGGTNSPCPQQSSGSLHLGPAYIVDRPGNPFVAAWTNRLFINAGVGNPGNVYVTVYARNNVDEPPPTAVETDEDGRITIVGEAMMTFTGAIPLADKSNVRVRKMIAADIIQPQLGSSGCNRDTHNQGSNYGC